MTEELAAQRVTRQINEALGDSVIAMRAIVEGSPVEASADEMALYALRILRTLMPICIELAGELDLRSRLGLDGE